MNSSKQYDRITSYLSMSIAALLFGMSSGFAQDAPCTPEDQLAAVRNKWICPVVGGGKPRKDADACANGGLFKSLRTGGRLHNALDINAAEGTGVVASKPGRAVIAGSWGKMGNTVIIDHGDGDYSIYGHLRSVSVAKNACVKASDALGQVGYTGNAQCLKDHGLTAHLHFAILRTSKTGLANEGAPIAAAIKDADDWMEISQDYFGGDMLDLGIKDPQVVLQNTPGCLK
jgi:hypothetical protein